MMQEVSRQGSGRGSATMLNTGQKLMWASCLCTIMISLQFLSHPADAAPVLASSLGFCQNVPIKAEPKTLNCCLPAPVKPAKRFKLPVNPIMRERKPAHVLAKDLQYVEKYNRAYRMMKSLPIGDPRSYDTQWKTHCAFCNEAFLQRIVPGPEGPDVGIPLQVHYSGLFLPWHRMLIYFHERILGSLINDPTFALPFWNWDNHLDEGANQIPSLFLDGFEINNFDLRDANRNPDHFPPAVLWLKYSPRQNVPEKTKEEIKDDNLIFIHNQVVNQIGAVQFFGGPYVVGTDYSTASTSSFPGQSGAIESLHNTAHQWVGFSNDDSHPDNEDMGTFIYAGKDPIFYSHHANIDRLWEVWKTIPDTVTPSRRRKRLEFDVEDFLDTEFTFYDENGEMVIVKVEDTFNIAELGYKYTKMTESDRLWIEYKSNNSGTSKATAQALEPSNCPEVDPNANNTISDTTKCFKVSRRSPNEDDLIGKEVKEVDLLAEGVVMEGLRIPHTFYLQFDAFINQPSANNGTDVDQVGYVGTFSHLPSADVNASSPIFRDIVEDEAEFRTVDVRFSTSNALASLGITNFSTPITVTIVPTMAENATANLTFTSLKQEFQ